MKMDFRRLRTARPAKLNNFLIVILVISGVFDVSHYAAAEDLKITVHPKDLYAAVNDTDVILECQFNKPVNCMWHRNDNPLQISERYQYLNSFNGKSTNDCSFRITSVKDLDFGSWQCENTVEKNEIPRKSQVAYIRKHTKPATTVPPLSADNEDLSHEPTIIVEYNNNDKALLHCSPSEGSATDYQWEYCPADHGDTACELSSISNSISTDGKEGLFRCSAKVDGQRISSTQYRIIGSQNATSSTVFIIMGAAIAVLVGVLSACVYFIIRPKTAIRLAKMCGFNNKSGKNKDEKKPLMGSPGQQTEMVSLEKLDIFSDTIVESSESHSDEMQMIEAMKHNQEEQKQLAPGIFLWRIDNFSGKRQMEESHGNGNVLESGPFEAGDGFRMKLWVFLNGIPPLKKTVSLGLEFVPSDSQPLNDGSLFDHRRTFLLLDRSPNADGGLKHIVRTYEPRFNGKESKTWMQRSFGPKRFANHILLERNRERYLVDDVIVLKVIIEPLASIIHQNIPVAKNETIIWKIKNVLDRKKDEMFGVIPCLTSESFYAFDKGYRIKFVLYLNGSGEGKGGFVSILFAFFKGQFDFALPPASHHKVEIKLFEQTGNGKKKSKFPRHISRSEILNPKEIGNIEAGRRMNEFRGFPKFVQQSEIMRFLTPDGDMFIEITFKSLDDKDSEKSSPNLDTMSLLSNEDEMV